MTVDEAIIYLSDMKIKIAIPKAAVQARLNNDALDMAINALNCSEFPNNSDTISRQQAISEAERWLYDGDDKRTIGEMLRDLPSVQLERKTGRWIPDNTDYYRTKFICSACGESEEVPTTGFGYGTMWDYCPMCGAKMEGGEQDDTD